MKNFKDLTNEKIGRLTIIRRVEDKINPKGRKLAFWLCRCDCGVEKEIRADSLKNNKSLSCGCLNREISANTCKNRIKTNTFEIVDDYVIGYTETQKPFYFDLDDFELIKDYYWNIHEGYVVSVKRGTTNYIKMHSLILDRISMNDKKIVVDHIDRNKSNNRKSNLRVVSNSLNQINRDLRKDNSSGYTGVSFDNRSKKWMATINKDGIGYFLGYFEDKEQAVVARNKKQKELYGE